MKTFGKFEQNQVFSQLQKLDKVVIKIARANVNLLYPYNNFIVTLKLEIPTKKSKLLDKTLQTSEKLP